MNVFEQKKYDFVHNCKIPYLAEAGIVPEIIEPNHVRFVLPAEHHINHVGIIYAGSYFVLAESAGASLIFASYAPEKSYTPIIANVTIDYHKPSKESLVVDMTMDKADAAERIKYVDERGMGRYPLDVPVCDMSGNLCATAHITYYLYANKTEA